MSSSLAPEGAGFAPRSIALPGTGGEGPDGGVITRFRYLVLLGCMGAAATWVASAASLPKWVEIRAGAHARRECPVSVPWPYEGPAPALVSGEGHGVAVQVSEGRAWFVEPGLGRGEARRYAVRVSVPEFASSPTVARTQGERLELLVRGRTAAEFVAGPGKLPRKDIGQEYRRGGYLHPVLTPSGRGVTDDYPTNHIHHHGLWFSWTKTRFEGRTPDFWNMGQKIGRTDFDALEGSESGAVFAGFRSRQVYTDLRANPPRIALRETWRVRVYAVGQTEPYRMFDVESEQQCASESALELPTYHYGGFAYRARGEWDGATGLEYLDSNGETNRAKANATRPRWFWMGGPLPEPGRPVAGLVQFGHPANFRSPQPIRVHPTEPYSCWAPSQAGDWAIRPGETYVSRYRVAALDGRPDPAEMERLWRDYAEPPEVRLGFE